VDGDADLVGSDNFDGLGCTGAEEDVAAAACLRGVVGGVTVDVKLGLRCLLGEGVFNTSTSLSEDAEELEELELDSIISREMGAAPLGGRAGLFPASALAVLDGSFFGRPRPLRTGGASCCWTTGAERSVRITAGLAGLSSSLLLSESDNLDLFVTLRCLLLRLADDEDLGVLA